MTPEEQAEIQARAKNIYDTAGAYNYEVGAAAINDRATLLAEIERLREYVDHKRGCEFYAHHMVDDPCTCGLAELLGSDKT